MVSEVQNLIEEYEINPYTLLIRPKEYGNKLYSEILEVEEEFTSPCKPIDIIKKSCVYFGSDYEGRRGGTKHLTGYTHKAPIEIEKTFSIYFFPTTSPDRESCVWIAQNHIDSFVKKGAFETLVTFRNKQKIALPISFSTFETQVARTAILKTKLDQRVKETGQRYR